MRHIARTLAGLVLIVLLVGGAAVLWRTTLAEVVGERWLAGYGFPDAALTVESLNLSRVVITDLSLGADGPTTRRIAVRFTPRALLEGRLESATIRGIRATVDPTAAEPLPWLPRGSGAAGSDGDGEAAAFPGAFPRVTVRDAVIRIRAPDGSHLPVHLDGELRDEAGPTVSATARAAGPWGEADLDVAAIGPAESPSLSATGTLDAKLAKLPAWLAPGARVRAGRLRLRIAHTGDVPDLGAIAQPDSLIATLGRTQIDAELADAAFLPDTGGVDASAKFTLRGTGDALVLTAPEPITLDAAAVGETTFAALGVPPGFRPAERPSVSTRIVPSRADGRIARVEPTASGYALSLAAESDADAGKLGTLGGELAAEAGLDRTFAIESARASTLAVRAADVSLPRTSVSKLGYEGTASLSPQGVVQTEGTLTAAVERTDLGGHTAGDLAMRAPLTARWTDPRSAEVRLDGSAWLRAGRLPRLGRARITLRERVAVTDARLVLEPDGMRAAATVEPGRIAAHGVLDWPVRADAGTISLRARTASAGPKLSAAFEDAAARVQGVDIRAQGITGSLSVSPDQPPRAELAVAELSHTGEPPSVNPLSVRAEGTRDDGVYRVEGAVSVAGTEVRLPVELRHDPATGRGRVALQDASITFDRGGLQPAALSPLLTDAGELSGRIRPSAGISWGPEGLASSGKVKLEDVTLTRAAVEVSGIGGSLAFESLFPPRTDGTQTVTASRVTAGIPLTELSVDVRATHEADGTPTIHVDELSAHLAEGQLRMGELVWRRPSGLAIGAPVHLSGVSLARLLDELNVSDVGGSGTLVGTLPVRVADGALLIDNGEMKAVGDGVLRVRLASAQRLEATGGEHVSMMMRALENFQYDTLSLRLNRPTPGEMRAAVTLAGKNPDVLDGYPFRFNITVSGDMRPLLTALRRGRALSGELLQDAIDVR